MCSICAAVCFCCLSVIDPQSQAEETPKSRFTVSAKVLEALEGGPVVLLVTLEYKGNEDIEITFDPWFNNAYVEPRASWEARPIVGFVNGRRYKTRRLSPGAKWSETHYLHRCFPAIPKGKVVLDVSWQIYEPGKREKDIAPAVALTKEEALRQVIRAEIQAQRGQLIACPTTTLEIEILTATRERVRTLCQRLEQKLANDHLIEQRGESVAEAVEYLRETNHPGLAPVAWRLIGSFPEAPMFLDLVYAAEDKAAVNRRLIKLACDPERRVASFLQHWRNQKIALTAEELTPLLRCENVWIRALTYLHLPEHCNKDWAEQLFRDLRQPLPSEVFARLLAELDNDDFSIREKATRALQQHGERVRSQLSKALQGNSSPEARRRMQLALDAIAEDPLPIAQTTLNLLVTEDTPQAEALLRALVEGPADWWATKEAKGILASRSKEKP